MKNLVIVESPAKAKTIEKYLGRDFKVLASMGHIRDLPKSKLGIDIEEQYKPEYVSIKGKGTIIQKLKKSLPKDGTVYLAQDLDREGEAIAWHVGQAIGLFDEFGNLKKIRGKNIDYKRIVFNEITKSAIQNAVKNPRGINFDLVDAQQARRVLDRLVGYKLSPLLWKKVRYGLSAGRVQSVVVKLIVDRERERDNFMPEEFWKMAAFLYKEHRKDNLEYSLIKYKGKKYQPKNKKQAGNVESLLKDGEWIVQEIKTKKIRKQPSPPFTTAKLQQTAFNNLGFSAKKTMMIAQKLYQGIDAGSKGSVALITYMRTDSVNLSNESIESIRKHIAENYSKELLPEKPNYYKAKSKLVQEAHEAIRPTDIDLTPEMAKGFLTADELKLYKLIWLKTVASQMVPAEYTRISIDVDNQNYVFRHTNQYVIKPGYLSVYNKNSEKIDEFNLKKGDKLKLYKLEKTQHFTQPPARYNEASLVKALESFGIGRPSTYAPIISTIQVRGYVSKENKAFKPEDIGYVVNDLLTVHFPAIVDFDFTSDMENDLDDIAIGKKKWVPVIGNFYEPFEKLLIKKEKEIKKEEIVVLGESDEKCELCDSDMVIKLGRYGRFLSCVKFPKCKGMKSLESAEDLTEILEKYEEPGKCLKCGKKMELKIGKYGRFWACSGYPDCKEVKGLLLKEKCPQCGSSLIERKGKWGKSFIGCSGYPNCKFIQKTRKK